MSEEFDLPVTELSEEKKRLLKQRIHEAIRGSVDENLRKMKESLAANDAGMACASAAELVNMVGDSYIYGMPFREMHDKVRGELDDLAPGGTNPLAPKVRLLFAGGDQDEPSDNQLQSIKARIETSRVEHEERLNELGELAGCWWVTNVARYDQLERLRESANGNYPETMEELDDLLFDPHRIDDTEVLTLWSNVADANQIDIGVIGGPHFVNGFFNGALELYEKAMAA